MGIRVDILLEGVDVADGIAEAQTTTSGVPLDLDGDLVGAGVARIINGAAVDNDSKAFQQVGLLIGGTSYVGTTLTIVGNSSQGRISEDVAGLASGTATSVNYFSSIESITPDIGVAGNISAGWNISTGISSQIFPLNWRQSPFNVSLRAIEVSGAAELTVESSMRDPQKFGSSYSADGTWTGVTDLEGITDSKDSNLNFPVQAVRVLLASVAADEQKRFQMIEGLNL